MGTPRYLHPPHRCFYVDGAELAELLVKFLFERPWVEMIHGQSSISSPSPERKEQRKRESLQRETSRKAYLYADLKTREKERVRV